MEPPKQGIVAQQGAHSSGLPRSTRRAARAILVLVCAEMGGGRGAHDRKPAGPQKKSAPATRTRAHDCGDRAIRRRCVRVHAAIRVSSGRERWVCEWVCSVRGQLCNTW